MLSIKNCVDPDDIMSTFPIMHQLRPKLKIENYFELIQSLKNTDGYHLVALFHDKACVAVTGYRIRRRLFSDGNPEIYVDDLVTDNAYRSKGYGKMLFDWLIKECKKSACQAITLDTGTQRLEAHQFYYRQGMRVTSLHFRRSCSPDAT